ncbi:MAG: hypothetical protein RSC91_11825 [Clostridia bacterium]
MAEGLKAAFATMPWWGYALAALAGIGFGALQIWLLRLAAVGSKPRGWLLAVKLLGWLLAFVVLGILSVPLLLAFAFTATCAQLVSAVIGYQKSRKEAK